MEREQDKKGEEVSEIVKDDSDEFSVDEQYQGSYSESEIVDSGWGPCKPRKEFQVLKENVENKNVEKKDEENHGWNAEKNI